MNLEFSTEIRCTPRALWPWLTEPQRLKQWMKGLVGIEPGDPASMKVGAVAKMSIKEGRRIAVYDEKILELEPTRRLRIALSAPHWKELDVDVAYTLHDLGAATRLDYQCCMRTTRRLYRILGTLFGFLMKMQARRFMNSLKRLAESDAAGARVTAA